VGCVGGCRRVTPSERCLTYLAAFATGDAEAVVDNVTDDFINEHTSAMGSGCTGRDEYARRVPGFLASMPGLHYDVEDVVAEGDRVMVAYTLHTHVNERDVAVRGVMRFLVRDDRIAHRIDYWDSMVFKQQAGME
jgi:limonene-1,2-epoxide hydrolase